MSEKHAVERIGSYYNATCNDKTRYPTLEGDIQADIVIVGAGSTGINTAVELAERGFDVVVVEANRVGWGATGRNGGQVTGSLSGDAAIHKQMRKMIGSDANDVMRMLRWHGHQIITQRVGRYGIECDLTYGHLHTAYRESDIPELQSSLRDAQQAGLEDNVRWLDKDQVHEKLATTLYHGGVLNTYNMHLHSLNLCLGEAAAAVSQGARIFEQSPVTSIDYGNTVIQKACVKTNSGSVSAKTIILAGNAYHRLAQKALKGLVFPAILGNLATTTLDTDLANALNPDNLAVYDSRMVLDYYRLTADNRLMFGGGTNYSGRDINDVANTLRPALEKTFHALHGVAIEFAWTGTAGIVVNRIPALGRVQNNVYYAQGYSGHGIASSHIMAEIMAEAISGTLDRFDLFSQLKHIRLPVGPEAGSALIALGMAYYRLRDRIGQIGKA
ncbi:MAG: NAD(P)/FAD-dependent oxidoreductase [Granulosicoccus sp.]